MLNAIEAGSSGRGKSCNVNADCKRGLACDIRGKHPATHVCLGALICLFINFI